MKIYISPAGKTALAIDDFLKRAYEEFGFDIAVLLTSSDRCNRMYEKFRNSSVIIVPISDPLYGTVDYIATVRRILKKVVTFCCEPESIILNSSGGTEKMTNIIKDIGNILACKYPVKRVWGVYDTVSKDVIYTVKPELNAELELSNAIREVASLKHEGEYDEYSVDVDEI